MLSVNGGGAREKSDYRHWTENPCLVEPIEVE
jgi:hypothetical protein